MTAKIAELQARLEKAQRELREAKNKADTRRKIILGSCVLSAVKKGVLNDEWLNKLLEKFVTRKSDREFLGLPPLGNAQPNNSPPPPPPRPYQEGT